MFRCFTCNVTCAAILSIFILFSMIWYCRIQSTAVSKERDVRWCGFRYSIPLSIDYVWESCINMDISILSRSYCICNRYWQNHRSILPNLPLFAWFDTLEFNRRPWSNNKIYDDADFAFRFRYQFAMFGIRVLIWLSSHLHAHISYITDGATIITAFFRISYSLHDFIRLNSIVGDVQTTRCTKIWFSMIDSDINWLCLKCVYSRAISTPWYSYCIWNSHIKNHHW